LREAPALGDIKGVEQVDVDGFIEDRQEPFMCFDSAELFGDRRENIQFGEGLFEPALPIADLVVAGGQVQLDLRPDVVVPTGCVSFTLAFREPSLSSRSWVMA
jgi:hypothetical protein